MMPRQPDEGDEMIILLFGFMVLAAAFGFVVMIGVFN